MNKLTFSLLLVGLFAAVALARTSPQIRRPFKFTPGQTYIYEYRGRQWNGIANLADQYAGLTLDCDVILQAQRIGGTNQEVLMKLDDIKVEQLHTQALSSNDIRKLNQGKEVNQRQQNLYKSELAKPIRFTYLDGKVVRFVAEASDPEWSINIKKSILSMFQLDLAPTKIIKSQGKQMAEQRYGYLSEDVISSPSSEMPLVYPIYEESFGGICETLYEIDSNDNTEKRQQKEFIELSDVLNVTKTVNFKNCLTDPSVSYDRHSFNVNTQTVKGKLFASQIPSVAGTNYNYVPEELKQKYSNAYTSTGSNSDNVGSPIPVERHSYTKYNITTAPQSLVQRPSVPVSSPADMSLIEGIYSEGKIKYQADGDTIVSDTQQSLKLISCAPTSELARVAPEVSALGQVDVRQPQLQYETIQCELNAQKVKFYQALFKFASLQKSLLKPQSATGTTAGLYSHQLALPFALSASWFPIIAGESEQASLERMVDPEPLAKSFEHILVALADDVLAEDVAQSKQAGEKVVRLVNIIAFMPKYKLAEVYERIVSHIQQAKQQQMQSRAKQALVDNDEVAKWKIVRKLYLDSLPLAGSKQSVEMIELLIQGGRVKSYEAREMCEAVPANLRYPDTEIIDAFIRISQLPQVRKSRSLFASCSIACGKMIGQAYAKSKDASYKPTTYQQADKLPAQLEQADDILKQVVEEADPRRQLPLNWASQQQEQLYDRLVLDEQDLTKYVRLFKSLLEKTSQHHEKVIYIETLAHMKVPQVLPILEPFITGRLSLGQCLGQQPLDILSRGAQQQQQQFYNYYSQQVNADSKDWNEQESFAAEECNYMRTIVIYALAHLARTSPGKVQSMLLPVFDNTYEPYQIRIAAFTTMMLTPIDEHVLERIASQMWREPSKEVASFVVGSIDTMSKFTSPSMAPWKFAATKAADSMPKQYLDTWKYSWAAGGDHFNYQKDTGLTWFAEVIKSNVSSIPRAAYAHMGRFHGPAGSKFDNHLEVGFTSKGLESLIKEYIAYNKQQQTVGGTQETNILASIFENLYETKDDLVKFYREARDSLKSSILTPNGQNQAEKSFSQNFFFKRQQPIEGVNTEAGKQSRKLSDLFEGAQRSKRSVTFQARSSQNTDEDEEPKLTLFTKVFDSTNYHSLDKKQLLELFEQADDYIKQLGEELVMGGKLHYVKMIMPSNMWHMVPSQLGLPITVTHRTPIVLSLKLDASQNGQLTSNKMSQYLRQQATGSQVPNTVGQNFITMQGLNITALVHPKIMHSEMRFMFAADQSCNEAYGVQVEKSHQVSLPMELSVAYSQPKQLVSMSIEPKTSQRFSWTKESAKTFIGQIALAGPSSVSSSPASWLGQEHLIRVPSKESSLKIQERQASFVPSLLTSVQDLINEPKQQQLEAIEELETPYKFDRRSLAKELGLEFFVEGATDDVDIFRSMGKRDLSKQSRGQLQWSSTDEVDSLDQHSKSGPFAELLHVIESASNRPSKYMEFYGTLRPSQVNGQQRSPCYRFDFVLSGKQQQSPLTVGLGRRQSANSLDVQASKMWNAIEQSKKFKLSQAQQYLDQQQQPIVIEGY